MFRSGYVAIVGMPNVGKSTLMNRLLEEKLSIVTDKPQTTRHRILGIIHRPKAQILLLDTPGIHRSEQLLNEQIVQVSYAAIHDADLVLQLVWPKAEWDALDEEIHEQIVRKNKPCVVVINQVDRVEKNQLLPLMQKISERWNPLAILPLSAQTGEGVDGLISLVAEHLPEGPAYYDTDSYTTHDLRFLCEEIIREKAMLRLHRELPYQLVTQVETFKEEKRLVSIQAAIIVEKPSQKSIVVGARGSMIKTIGSEARVEIEKLVGKKVYLELFVKVVEGWTKDKNRLKEFGILRH